MRKSGLPYFILFMSALYIFLIPSEPMALKLVFKLIPMWLIIAYAWLSLPAKRKRYHSLMLLGLFCCMLGDGLLFMFVVGLTAFLIGHLFYTASFISRWHFSRRRVLFIVPLILYAAYMGSQLVSALMDQNKQALILPVVLYVTVISAMAFTAVMTGQRAAAAGSLLFVVSDSILSWNMFISEITYANILIMTTYYSAQFLLTYSLRQARSSGHSTVA